MRVLAFASPAEFLAATLPDLPSCLILDVRLPGLSGLDFHDEMTRSRADIPVIFLTGYADIAMTVRALKSGAVDFLEKPFRDQQLLDAVNAAVVEARRRRGTIGDLTALRAKAGMLSSRERDVMRLVTRGLMNKQVAAELGVSEITVKVHRANLMRKLEIRTLADLVRMAQQFDEF
jgi:FixJ family two-component response regulator